MSKGTGFVLIVSGVAVAAFLLPEGDLAVPDLALWRADAATEIAKSRLAEAAPPAAETIVAPQPRPAFRPVPPARTPEPAASAPIVVTVAQRPSDGSAALPRASIPRDRDTLVRELQKELRRVGCYDGEINGVWTPATRRAMKTFTDRANASLPVEEPDAVLYAMVQGQHEAVCGKACPTGQGLSEEGRCVPAAILAKATRKPSPAPTNVAAHRPPAEHKPASAITGWSTTTTPAPPPTSMAAAQPAPAAPALGPPPTEGRMALAGPVPAEPVNPALAATPAGPPAPPQAARPAPPKPAKSQSSWAMQILARRDSQN
jgi:peptidoglycan hydrolase-like protein with peptidoglycan-binding domain